MKPYDQLTERGRVQRIKALAKQALTHYDVEVESLSLIYHGENTTFRAKVREMGETHAHLSSHDLLVRCHRPHYNSPPAIDSELVWLKALHDAGIPVQLPLANKEGQWVTFVCNDGLPQGRHCTILRWAQGRFYDNPKPIHLERLGKLTARLHEHVQGWSVAQTFYRERWDQHRLLTDVHGHVPDEKIWSHFSTAQRAVQAQAMDHVYALFEHLESVKRSWTLIHSDLHFGNVMFNKDKTIPIDFDDCGYGLPIQDIATTLTRWDGQDDFGTMKEAYLKGYATQAGQRADDTYLLDFILTRRTQMAIWLIERSEDVPKYKKMLPKWLARNTAHLERLLPQMASL